MRAGYVFACLLLPLLAVAQSQLSSAQQSSSPSASQQQSPGSQSAQSQSSNSTSSPQVSLSQVVVTSFSVGVTVSNGATSTFSSPVPITSFSLVTEGAGGNNTSSGGGGSSSPTSTAPVSTAPSSIDGGGSGAPNGAPSPGQTGANGMYGPDDGYVSPALALRVNALLAAMAGLAVGGAVVLA